MICHICVLSDQISFAHGKVKKVNTCERMWADVKKLIRLNITLTYQRLASTISDASKILRI